MRGSSAEQDGANPSRAWWLNTGLARLAFGTGSSWQGESQHPGVLPRQALELDLDDPEQREFGEYELLEQVGQGGMGVVYRARQKRLERDVAIKLLSAGPWASDEFVAAFRREARNAASLQHPNIVPVYEMDEHEGLVFYAMQLVRGESLAQCLARRRRLPAREAATLLRTVAEAVDYAHRLGVLHLDLKPGNILLGEDGVVQVTDFGLARQLGQAISVENEQVSGTPGYMAPEQAQLRSARLSPATDIWGLGAILFELLTGQPPFTGPSPQAILQRVRAGELAPSAQLAAASRDLAAICLKCLAREPQARYPTARALADDLGRFLDGRAVLARPLRMPGRAARWARREPRLAIASGLLVLTLLGGLAATTGQWQRAEANAAAASERLWQGRREAALDLQQEGAGWAALPQLLENVREQEQAGRSDAALLDRTRAALLLAGGATLVDVLAIPNASPLAVALSADGRRLALAFDDYRVRWYETGSLAPLGEIDLSGLPSSGGEQRAAVLLRFLDDARLVATLEWYRDHASPAGGDSWLLDLEQRRVLQPPAGFADFSDASFSGDGRTALLRNLDGEVQAWQVTPWAPLSGLAAVDDPPGAGGPRDWLLSQDGRHALTTTATASRVALQALPSLQPEQALQLTAGARATAWAFASDGRSAAVGDTEGRVFLWRDGQPGFQRLPAARGANIAWLAFSEDGAWLASGGSDGRVHAFAVASGDALVSGAMEHGFAVDRVGISRARRLLLVAGQGQTALWRIPSDGGPGAMPPMRLPLPPALHRESGPYAVDWSLATGLLASAGRNGELRLWRLPPPPLLPVVAARQLADAVHGDGRHVVDVAWDRVRLAGMDGRAGPWLALAQPPGFAELVGGGETLVLTVGAELQLLDAPALTPRARPLTLPDSPQRLLVDGAGRFALLSFAGHGVDGFLDELRLYDLREGKAMDGMVALAGPLQALAFSPEADRIVAVGPPQGATTVLSRSPLRVVAEYQHDPFHPVIAADFAADGTLLLLERALDPRAGADTLLAWEPGSDRVLAEHDAGQARPFGLVALPGGAFLPGERAHLLLEQGQLRALPRPQAGFDSSMGAYAASADRSLLAVASRRQVQLYTPHGEPLGPPLGIDTPTTDGIVGLGFSDDGKRLLARTIFGTAQWPLARALPEPGVLDALLARLVADGSPRTLRLPSAAQRAALRANDPGPWPGPEPRPAPLLAGHAHGDGSPIPARAPGTPATLLDLSAQYTTGPDSARDSHGVVRPFLRPYPAGVQQMAGTDFDLRGMAEAGPDGLAACIAVPPGQAVAALHALLVPTLRTREDQPRLLAELLLDYADGSQARVPIRTTREVPGFGGKDQAVPLAFSVRVPIAVMGFRSSVLAAPRLVNPHPERALRCVDLRTTGAPMLLLAMTVEAPAAPPATAGASTARAASPFPSRAEPSGSHPGGVQP